MPNAPHTNAPHPDAPDMTEWETFWWGVTLGALGGLVDDWWGWD